MRGQLKALLGKIKKVYKNVRNPFWWAKSRYIKYYKKLPLNEKAILLESEHGKKLDGNIFYILRYLSKSEQYSEYKIYLSSMGRACAKIKKSLSDYGIDRVEVVLMASDTYMRLLASAKYLINDTSFGSYFVKKPGQIYLNTWHGTPLKALGKNDKGEFYNMGNIQKNFVCSDFLLCPNEHTKKSLVRDYMLENIGKGTLVNIGYPRNEAFFEPQRAYEIKKEQGLLGKRIYAYLPTYRGAARRGQTSKSDIYLLYSLYEIDKRLADGEIFFVNLHPLASSKVDFSQFEHIQAFPADYEIYEFLNTADILVTDYSSVFFDFTCTRKKIILFPFDEEDYLHNRGMYLSMDDLPFPKVETVDALLRELHTEKRYDDQDFLETFCRWDGPGVSQRLCDFVILNLDTGLVTEKIPDNGKENVLIYAGNLAGNGITTSLRSLLSVVDRTKRNYYISFVSEYIKEKKEVLYTFPKEVNYFPTTGDMNLTFWERIIRKLFKIKVVRASLYMKLMDKRVHQDLKRKFGTIWFDTAIQFNGYENEVILNLSTFEGKTAIFVHADMLGEIKTKGNQRKDVLAYAYKKYDKVVVVAPGMIAPTYAISKKKDNIVVCKNAIDYGSICKKSSAKIILDPVTQVFPSKERFFEIICSSYPKFINVGRFAPEKGHERLINAFSLYWKEHPNAYLVIMGGYSLKDYYEKTAECIKSLGLENNVILLCQVSNPYPILNACDNFVLSSFYEGFGLVLMEADILGKPVISTDIPGPRDFMLAHGGTLVKNSEEGILNGIKMLAEGKVHPLNVDYEAYNQEVIQEFEQLFQ